jgi:hypothetical protein
LTLIEHRKPILRNWPWALRGQTAQTGAVGESCNTLAFPPAVSSGPGTGWEALERQRTLELETNAIEEAETEAPLSLWQTRTSEAHSEPWGGQGKAKH